MSLTERTRPTRQHKRVPIRSCVVCRQRSDKRTLIRLVKTEDGVYVDPTGKRSGRGAYLCDSGECWEQAVSTGILNQALRTVLTDADRQRLKQALPQR